jgi:multiple sugar transport system ATP-binding protein
MDEPLSNLDAQLRLQMRAEIKRLQRELEATTLYVTHDQVEAMTMADLVAVMSRGRLQQLASPAELYARPANLFVAGFIGSPPMNVLAGTVADGVFTHPSGSVALPGAAHRGDAKLGFRPEHAALVEPGIAGAFAGEIYVVEPLGNETLVAVDVGGTIVNLRAAAEFTAAIGQRCAVLPEARHLHLFDAETGDALGARRPADDRPAEAPMAGTTPRRDG